jgi:hypothetical protein
VRITDLRRGWEVVGNDGQRVGSIVRVGQNYILTSRPGMAADVFVPVSFVANVENKVIHLNIRQPDVSQMGWEQEPRADDALEVTPADDLHRHI